MQNNRIHNDRSLMHKRHISAESRRLKCPKVELQGQKTLIDSTEKRTKEESWLHHPMTRLIVRQKIRSCQWLTKDPVGSSMIATTVDQHFASYQVEYQVHVSLREHFGLSCFHRGEKFARCSLF